MIFLSSFLIFSNSGPGAQTPRVEGGQPTPPLYEWGGRVSNVT